MIFEKNTNKVPYKHYMMNFGKYKGKFLIDIYNIDRDYFIWLADTATGELRLVLDYILGIRTNEEIERDEREKISNRRRCKKNVSKGSKGVRKKQRVVSKNNSGPIILPSELY